MKSVSDTAAAKMHNERKAKKKSGAHVEEKQEWLQQN